MKKTQKLIILGIVTILFIYPNIVSAVNDKINSETKVNDTNQEKSFQYPIGRIIVTISKNPSEAEVQVELYSSGGLTGEVEACYQVLAFYEPGPGYKITAYVDSNIWLYRRYYGESYRILYVSEGYEFCNSSAPEPFERRFTENVNTNTYDTQGSVTLTVNVWVWNPTHNAWWIDYSFDKTAYAQKNRSTDLKMRTGINCFFHELIENYSYMFRLQKLLFQR